MRIAFGGLIPVTVSLLFAAMPTSSNYSLKTYDLGAGGGNASSGSYNLNAVTGTQTGTNASSSSYGTQSGLASTTNSNVPPAPTVTNPSSYYDRLRIILSIGGNPSDTKFAIAISPDAFATTTQYVKADNSIGATLTASDYQTYASWGGASGFLALGLSANTTYTVKVKAMQGQFTETAYGPTASAATIAPSITFAVATVGNPTPPFSVSFASLAPGSVFDGSDDASLSLSTNALSGGGVYVSSLNAGLKSNATSFTLPSATTDLAVATRGYGAIITAITQTTGGPLAASSPFNGAAQSVGGVTTGLQQLASTSAPVTGGSITVRLKAKTDSLVPGANDYTDTVTFIAAVSF